MLPSFPSFRRLTLADRGLISNLNRQFPPYSDFNFTSLWCWDVLDQVRISNFEGNLVVRFTDYLNGRAFFSLLGKAITSNALWALLSLARRKSMAPVLKLIPTESLSDVRSNGLQICEDPDNFDYVLSVSDMTSFSGHSFRHKRYFANRFSRQYLTTTRQLDLANASVSRAVEQLLERWAVRKGLTARETHNEFTAIFRLFACCKDEEFLTVGIFDRDRLIGLSVIELLERSVAMLHVEKADTEYFGIYPYLMRETARRLATAGRAYLNYEQDLGLTGFRQSKRSFRPCSFLRKSRVSLADSRLPLIGSNG